MDRAKASDGRWFNRNVFAFGLTSFLSDFCHEIEGITVRDYVDDTSGRHSLWDHGRSKRSW